MSKSELPDVNAGLVDRDLFTLLGNRPITFNVAAMFETTRRVVGGKIRLVDIYFEDGVVLWNVRIANERIVTIPESYSTTPIRTVGVPDAGRHAEWPAMRAEFRTP